MQPALHRSDAGCSGEIFANRLDCIHGASHREEWLTREPPEAEHRFFNENYLGY